MSTRETCFEDKTDKNQKGPAGIDSFDSMDSRTTNFPDFRVILYISNISNNCMRIRSKKFIMDVTHVRVFLVFVHKIQLLHAHLLSPLTV